MTKTDDSKEKKSVKKTGGKEIKIEFKSEVKSKSDENLEKLVETLNEDTLASFVPLFQKESKTGTLSQIAVAPKIITSGQVRRDSSPQEASREEIGPFKYDISSKNSEDNQIKYTSPNPSFRIEQTNIHEVGRQNLFVSNQSGRFVAEMSEMSQRGMSSSNVEKYTVPDRMDVSKEGRKNIFEKDERKYDPKLP